jgi:hypothetical protein
MSKDVAPNSTKATEATKPTKPLKPLIPFKPPKPTKSPKPTKGTQEYHSYYTSMFTYNQSRDAETRYLLRSHVCGLICGKNLSHLRSQRTDLNGSLSPTSRLDIPMRLHHSSTTLLHSNQCKQSSEPGKLKPQKLRATQFNTVLVF